MSVWGHRLVKNAYEDNEIIPHMLERRTTTHPIASVVERDHGVSLHFDQMLHGGVSGDEVWRATLQRQPQEDLPMEATTVVKIGNGIGTKEVTAAEMVGPHLPLVPHIVHGENYVVYPFIDGETVDQVVRREAPDAADTFDKFTKMHADLWEKTITGDVKELNGYPQKLEHTRGIVYGMELDDVNGIKVPVQDIALKKWTVNGEKIGTLEDVFGAAFSRIRKDGQGVITHGDEGAGNAIRPQGSEEILFIDHGTAGLRGQGESIAKILLWFEATTQIPGGYSFERHNGDVSLTTNSHIPEHLHPVIARARKQLEPWMATDEDKQEVAANMMMYLWREIQWLQRRGRTEMSPYLLAKALSFAPAVEGKDYPFPLSAPEPITKTVFKGASNGRS